MAFVVTPTKQAKKNLEDIPVVYEYLDVFLLDYFGLPSQREVEFGIECVLDTNPISKVVKDGVIEVEEAKGIAPRAFG